MPDWVTLLAGVKCCQKSMACVHAYFSLAHSPRAIAAPPSKIFPNSHKWAWEFETNGKPDWAICTTFSNIQSILNQIITIIIITLIIKPSLSSPQSRWGVVNSYDGLYRETPPERGIFSSLRWWIPNWKTEHLQQLKGCKILNKACERGTIFCQ